MINGFVNRTGSPLIPLRYADQDLMAVVDSGFNGDLELPETFFDAASQDFIGSVESFLAGGQQVEEDMYEVRIVFDGTPMTVETTFADTSMALVGTRLMKEHRLLIDFVQKTLSLKRPRETTHQDDS